MLHFYQHHQQEGIHMLNLLTLDEAALRTALREDEVADYFENFDSDELEDGTLVQLVTVLNDSHLFDSGNADLAGERSIGDRIIEPSESIDLTLVANTEGIIEGYEFSYDLWGARRLSLASTFWEWRHIRPEVSGEDGLVELAHMVLAIVNNAIRDFNEFLAGVAA